MRLYLFFILVCCATVASSQHWDTPRYGQLGGGFRGALRSGPPLGTNFFNEASHVAAPSTPSASAPQSQHTKTPISSGGVGAWGYMAIILSVVLSGIGVYYAFLLYPVVCKKERMYDVMEMTAV